MAHILVVEDESHIAEGLQFNLEAEGHEVAVATDGAAALTCLQDPEPRFDLVLLDLMLPRVGGLEVLRRIRAAGDFVPVLILTAMDSAQDLACCGGDAGTAPRSARTRPRSRSARARRTSSASSWRWGASSFASPRAKRASCARWSSVRASR
jgi:CheY-like chemotaxis protein